MTKHGMSRTPEYRAWIAMQARCDPANKRMARFYAARGIAVSPEWIGDGGFERFFAHVGRRPPGQTLDRRDNSRGYEPGNVRWATRKEQQRNMRSNLTVTFRGQQMTAAQAAELAGLPYDVVIRRLTRFGWTDEEALTVPALGRAGKRERRELLAQMRGQ